MSYTHPAPVKRQPRITEVDLLKARVKELELELKRVVDETNNYVAIVEAHANERMGELLQKQIEADGKVLDCWQQNVEELLAENEGLRTEVETLRIEIGRLQKSARADRPKVKRKGRKKGNGWELEDN